MTFYKFLSTGRVGAYSGFVWPVGSWVEVEPPLVPTRRGIHACTLPDLPFWLDEELWIVELQGELLEDERMVVASLGCLVEQVRAWDRRLLGELASVCLARRCHDAALLEDATYWDDAISTVYMAANAAGLESERAGGSYEAGYLAERAWQADWVAGRLELAAAAG